MEILITTSFIIVILLYKLLNFVWKQPLLVIHSSRLSTLHFGAISGSSFLFLYIFFPHFSAEVMHIPTAMIHFVSIVMSIVLSSMMFYIRNTQRVKEVAWHPAQKQHLLRKYIPRWLVPLMDRAARRSHQIHTWYEDSHLPLYITTICIIGLTIDIIILISLFFRYGFGLNWIIAICLGIWLGANLQIMIRLDTDMFVEDVLQRKTLEQQM
jgi:hypothetical protein